MNRFSLTSVAVNQDFLANLPRSRSDSHVEERIKTNIDVLCDGGVLSSTSASRIGQQNDECSTSMTSTVNQISNSTELLRFTRRTGKYENVERNKLRPLSDGSSHLSFSSSFNNLFTGRKVSSRRTLSPESRRAIVNSNEGLVEPVCSGGYLTSCTADWSLLELRKATWKIPANNSEFEGLEKDDRILVEIQGGLSFEEEAAVDILEAVVLLQSHDHTIVIISHEKVSFTLVGGSIPVRVFLVKRVSFERKFNAVSTTGQSGLAGLRIACAIKVVQGPPRSEKIPRILRDIQTRLPRDSRVLFIGENIRELMDPETSSSLLNLANLRHNIQQTPNEEDHSELEALLRVQHFEILDQIAEATRDITELCNDYGKIVQRQKSKQTKNEELQEALTRLEDLQQVLEENDKRLANGVFADVQCIYGTIEDVRNGTALVKYLEPAATIVFQADTLPVEDLQTVFSLHRNNIYLSIDTPFFWQNVKEWKAKGGSGGLFRKKHLVSEEFISRLQQFISSEFLSVEFIADVDVNNDFLRFFSCFKHNFDSISEKPSRNIIVLKHSEQGDKAIFFERNVIANIRKLSDMAGQHGHRFYCVSDDGRIMLQDDIAMEAFQLNKIRQKVQTDVFVSLHGLTVSCLPSLYDLVRFTSRKVYLIGNLHQLKKNDEHMKKFVSNLQASGFVQKSLVLTCPKHRCDVVIGAGSEFSSRGWQTGCQEQCDEPLPCGHRCISQCHIHNSEEESYKSFSCQQKCLRSLPCGHPCPYYCGRSCSSRCTQLVEVTTECGHLQRIPCWAKSITKLNENSSSQHKCLQCADSLPECPSLHKRSKILSRLLGTS